MKKSKNKLYLILGILLGITISATGVYAASTILSKDVSYDNSSSGLTATNLQDAIDETYEKAKTAKTNCPDGYTCTKGFADDSWTDIAAHVKAGYASVFYNVGDTKTIDMGSFGTHTLRVANNSSCTSGETSQTACGFVVEFADIITTYNMNSSDTNVGGWPASAMRTYVNGTIYNALPSDLRSVIASTTVVSSHGSSDSSNFTSTDKLYLLSTKEVWNGGTGMDTAESVTRQLDYYKNLGVTISNYSGAIKKYNGTANNWWLRSSNSNGTNFFIFVSLSGDRSITLPTHTRGVCPAFRIA